MNRSGRAASSFIIAASVISWHAAAGELSFTPAMNFSVDDDSDLYLVPEGPASQSEVLQLSGDIKGSTEASDFTISPLVRYQNFDSHVFENIFERNIAVTDAWTLERGKLTITGQDGDYSTLTTEATQTGLLSSQLHQRSNTGGLSYACSQTERLMLVLTGSYSDISYYGTADSRVLNLLEGYRYPSASVGEQYQLSETSSLLATIAYSKVMSPLSTLDSQTYSGDLEYHRSLSETFDVAATVGESEARSATVEHYNTGSLSITQTYSQGSLVFSYMRSLSPFGTGVLVQRQVFSASASRSLNDLLSVTLTASRVQNGRTSIQPLYGSQPLVQTYDSAQLLLAWQFAENWKLNAEVDTTRTQTPYIANYDVQEWRAAVSVTWTPRALTTRF